MADEKNSGALNENSENKEGFDPDNPFGNILNPAGETSEHETQTAGENETETGAASELTIDDNTYNLGTDEGIAELKAAYPTGKIPLVIGQETFEFDLNNADDIALLKKYADGEEVNLDEEVSDQGEQGKSSTIFELKDGDKTEKFDISKEEEKTKLINYFQKGRHYEQRMKEVSDREKNIQILNDMGVKLTNAMNNVYLRQNGASLTAEPILDTMSDDNGTEVRDDKGNLLGVTYNNQADFVRAKQRHNEILQALNVFNVNLSTTAKKFQAQVNDFQAKHPEVTDFTEWSKTNVDKYIDPITSGGQTPLPDDFFEMVWFWTHKDEFVQKTKEEERKKLAKAVTKKMETKRVQPGLMSSGSVFGELPNHGERKLISQR